MKMQVLGCSHQKAPLSLRERIAFTPEQNREALGKLRREYPGIEAVLLSTCNRVELYTAAACPGGQDARRLAAFVARFHRLEPSDVVEHLDWREGSQAVKHLFQVASSLDSMVLGEPQIVSQVKEAYQLADEQKATGPITHAAFQAAMRTARLVASQTAIHRHRVSIPSVAVAEFGRRVFERFDDKGILLIGAGEMAAETLEYLRAEGARRVTVVNRSIARAVELARRWDGRARPWEELHDAIIRSDFVVSTTGAPRAIVTLEDFLALEKIRGPQPLLVIDLAVPRDFEPAIGQRPSVYLYSIDDLKAACEANQRRRQKELPRAQRIVERETTRFMMSMNQRAVSPIVQRLRRNWHAVKEVELERLSRKLPQLDGRSQQEVACAFDRLINKLLHPPLETLRLDSAHGVQESFLDSVSRLFHLEE